MTHPYEARLSRPWPRPSVSIATVMALIAFVTMAAPAAAAGPPGQELIAVPIRWCAVQGSPAQANPASLGEPDTDNVLWRRHERPSDGIWIPGVNITFRSAFTALVLNQAEFPIIPDPNPPAAQGGTGAGQLGDILQTQGQPNTQEFNDVIASCRTAWQGVALPNNANLNGPIVVNVRQFVDTAGNPTLLLGRAATSVLTPANTCLTPPNYTTAQGGSVVIVDYTFVRNFDPGDRTLGHELGHVFNIWHGDGLDNEPDGQYDQVCDGDENVTAVPTSLMNPVINNATNTMTALQRATTRGVARNYTGATLDPPMALVNGDAIGDDRVDAVHDVQEESVDLVWASVTVNHPSELTVIALALYRLIDREDPPSQYLAFIDLDADPATGGRPADIGFATDFEGAELAVSARVEPPIDPTAPDAPITTAWVFEGGAWIEVKDERIRGDIQTIVDGDLMPLNHVITVELPLGLGGAARDVVRLQAIAEQLAKPGGFDVLPGEKPVATDQGTPLFLVPPRYPVCEVTPAIAGPGETVTVEVVGLLPDRGAHVVLGDQLVAKGGLDQEGGARIDFVIPRDAKLGPRLVTVGVDELALTADCSVQVFFDRDARTR